MTKRSSLIVLAFIVFMGMLTAAALFATNRADDITISRNGVTLATFPVPVVVDSAGVTIVRASLAATQDTLRITRDTVNLWRPAPPPPPPPVPPPPPPPPGYATLTDQPWTVEPPLKGQTAGQWTQSRSSPTVTDMVPAPAGWPAGSGNVMQTTFPAGHRGGTAPNYVVYQLATPKADLVVTFPFQASANWTNPNVQTKLAWFVRTGDTGSGFIIQTKPQGGPSICRISMNSQGLPNSNRVLGATGTYNPNICDGQVHVIQIRIAANSPGGVADGVFELDVDGQPVGHYSDVLYFGAGWPAASRTFERFRLEYTYGGGLQPAPLTMYWYVGHLTIVGR